MPKFLPEAEGGVDDVDEPHRHTELRHPGDERDQPAGPEEDRHEVGEVREEPKRQGLPLTLRTVFGPKRASRSDASAEDSPPGRVPSAAKTSGTGRV